MAKLTQEKLLKLFPLINSQELERLTGLRDRRLYDVRAGRSSLSEDDLSVIEVELRKAFRFLT